MSIGDMKPIILERWGQSKTATGKNEDTMLNRYKLWAEVGQLSRSKEYDRQVEMTAGYSFRIWYNKDLALDGLWKVIYEGSRYNIHSIERVKEKRFNLLLKTEGDVR